jgi:hypothetical protein
MTKSRSHRDLVNRLCALPLLIGAVAIASPAVAAAATPHLGSAHAVAGAGQVAPPKVSWAVRHSTPEVNGVAKGKVCKVHVSGSEDLQNLRINVVGERGAASLLPRDRHLLDRRIKSASFSCALDTRSLQNGPITVRATAVDASGKSRSATQEFIVNNPHQTTPAAPAAPATSGAGAQWFSPTSFWNRKFNGESPLAPKSSAYVSELVRQVNSVGPWINTDQYSAPVYTVGAEQPTSKVLLKPTSGGWAEPQLQAAFNSVPIPANAQPAAGTDEHLVVWQPSTNEMWEFWELRKENGGWVASYGGAMQNVSQSPGYYSESSWSGAKAYWGATATSLPLVGGLLTIKELQEGHINHAIAMAIPEPSPEYVWPAQRSDGFSHNAGAIPEGTIFRLPASVNVAQLNLPPFVRMLATAAQEYGVVVRDTSGCVCFYGEDPTPTGSNPYSKIMEGQYANNLLKLFPWASLQAVRPGT